MGENMYRINEFRLPKYISTNVKIGNESEDNLKIIVFDNCDQSGPLTICKMESISPNKLCAEAIVRQNEPKIQAKCTVARITTSESCIVKPLNDGYIVSTKEPLNVINTSDESKISIFGEEQDFEKCTGVCTVTSKSGSSKFICNGQTFQVKQQDDQIIVNEIQKNVEIDLTGLKSAYENDLQFRPFGVNLLDENINHSIFEGFLYRSAVALTIVIYCTIATVIITKLLTKCKCFRRWVRRKRHTINTEDALLGKQA